MFCTTSMLEKCLEFTKLTVTAVQTLFQYRSRAKHWFKNLTILKKLLFHAVAVFWPEPDFLSKSTSTYCAWGFQSSHFGSLCGRSNKCLHYYFIAHLGLLKILRKKRISQCCNSPNEFAYKSLCNNNFTRNSTKL